MTMPDNPALPEAVAVALQAAASKILTADLNAIPALLDPLREAWLDAIKDGEKVDVDSIYAAFPPLPANIADVAEQEMKEFANDAISAIPILLTFVDANPCRVLSGIRVLSFEVGRAGDDFEDWRNEATTALIWAMRLPEGPIPLRLDLLMDVMEDAFFEGRKAGGIEGDPPRQISKFYAARVSAARDAVRARLASTLDLDMLANDVASDFDIAHGDAWLAVEDVSRAAAVEGDLRAARLRSDQILGVHRWFVEHVDKVETRGAMTVGMMILRDRSRAVLREMVA